MSFSSSNSLYGFPQPISKVFPAPIVAQRAPQTSDFEYNLGQSWIDEAGNAAYTLVDVVANSAVWVATGGGSSAVSTLSGDTGTATPTAGNIQIAGTANEITTLGAASAVTLSLPANLIAPGSIAATTTVTTLGGNITCQNTAAGSVVTLSCNNLSAAASSNAQIVAVVNGGAAGDPYYRANISGGQSWVWGIDNSDSDAFVVSNGAVIGTGNIMRADVSSSIVSFPANSISLPTAGTAVIYNPTVASGAAGGTVTCNGRVGSVTFTGPSIAANAVQTFVMGNSGIGGASTLLTFSMRGATTGAALSIQSYTSSAGQVSIVVTNGVGATTQTGNLTFDFVVLN